MLRLCQTATLLCGLLLALCAQGADLTAGNVSLGGDTTVTTPVTGNSVLVGNNIQVLAEISGNLFATGRTINVQRRIGKNLFAAGETVTLGGPVAGKALVYGGTLTLTPESQIQGDASIAGDLVQLQGAVNGHLKLGGKDVLIDGTINGDVDAASDHIRLGPNARINGRLRYASSTALDRDPASEIRGTIERTSRSHRWQRGWQTAVWDEDQDQDWGVDEWPVFSAPWDWSHPYRHAVWGFRSGMAIFLALVIGALLPRLSQRMGMVVDRQWGQAVFVGLLAVIGTPILALILLITVIGIPFALILGLAWALLLYVGYALSGVAFGEVALYRLAPHRYPEAMMRVLAAVLAMSVLIMATRMPFLGGLVSVIATLTGIGALLLQMPRRGQPTPV